MPTVSCIICHLTGDLLYGCIDSINKSEGDVKFEIIILTSDYNLALKGLPKCTVIHHTGMPAEKRNAGARIARGKYLAFFDDDVTIDPLCLYHLLDGISGDVAMTYGKLWNMEHRNRFDEAGSYLTWTGFLWSRAGQNEIDNGQYSRPEYVLSGKSASCMITASAFKQVGGFDEDFGILGEETDLAWRLWLSGMRVLYTPQATGYHAFNTKYKPVDKHYTSSRVQYNGCRNYVTMLLKCLGKEHLWIVPLHMIIWTSAGVAMLITGKWRQGWNIMRGLWYIVSHHKLILKKRKEWQSKRVRTDKELFPIIMRRTPRGYFTQRFRRYLSIGLHG